MLLSVCLIILNLTKVLPLVISRQKLPQLDCVLRKKALPFIGFKCAVFLLSFLLCFVVYLL